MRHRGNPMIVVVAAGAGVSAALALAAALAFRGACAAGGVASADAPAPEPAPDVAGARHGGGEEEAPAAGDAAIGPVHVDAGPIDGSSTRAVVPASGSGALAGLVLDREGLPAVGAIVTVRRQEAAVSWTARRRPFERPSPGLAAARVEEDGFFRIDGLPAGPAVVEAGGAGYVRAVQRGVDVPPQGEAWVEFRLESGLSIAGRVLDDRGAPIAGAEIAAAAPGQTAQWTAAAADGSYELAGLRAGRYSVRADAAGHVGDERPEVRAGTTGVDFRLGRAGEIAGRVVWRGTGSPIAGAEVRAVTLGPRGGRRPGRDRDGRAARTGQDGAFLLRDVAPGRYVVAATAADRAPGVSPEVAVEAGRRVDGVLVELGEGARVSGVVRAAADGRPVEGATVRIGKAGSFARRPGPGPRWFGPPPGGPPVTDDAGRLVYDNVTPGSYLLQVPSTPGPAAPVPAEVREGQTTVVTVTANAPS